MENHRAIIKYKTEKSNLVNLPPRLGHILSSANLPPQQIVVELVSQTNNNKKYYTGWTGFSSSGGKDNVELDPIFAQALNIKENDKVIINIKIKNYEATNISLEPLTSSDWELVELHAQNIEDKLLQQSRCVALNQILVVYPSATTSAKLLVTDIGNSSSTYGIISPYCEIAIAPKVREKKDDKSKTTIVNKSSSPNKLVEDYSSLPTVLRRGISLPNDLYTDLPLDSDISGYEVYANVKDLPNEIKTSHVAVSIVPGPNDKQQKNVVPEDPNDTITYKENKRIIAKLINYPDSPANTIGLSSKLAIALNVELQVGNIVVVKPAVKNLSKRPSTFIIHPYIIQTKRNTQINLNSSEKKDQATKLINDLTNHLYSKQTIYNYPITNFIKIPIIPNILPYGGLLRFKKNDDINAWIKGYNIESKKPIKIEIGEELLRGSSFIEIQEQGEQLDEAIGLDDTIEDIISSFITSKNTGSLVYGNAGSGKSLVLKLVAKTISKQYGFYTKFISCETLMNENFNNLSKNYIFKWLQQCSWNKPSLLILDNLDKILNVDMEHVDSTKSNQLTEFLISNLEKIQSQPNSNLSILISSTSKESLNKLLFQSHLIENFNHLTPPDKQLRFQILQDYIVNKLNCKLKFDLMDLVSETEGYLPNDLKILSDRIYHEVLFNDNKDNEVYKENFQKSLEGYIPSNLRGVKLQKASIQWSDIGGLKDAKNILLETLEWPTRYAPIFENCPLRLRSGILLYGYPGCGKTLLASAVAGQCGLNFISIKGPEILNKYIGASEQSVRELFERAQAAKPCILFFDEFDSIAPKRGHDSTGVTDRVVNQMLTQMDGAEGLDGVYVLAATSRPDLIDSALLRPGRLDKSVICDMPNYEDRLDILTSISEKMDLSSDVNLQEIAKSTTGFSGADIQGLGYNAYLKAVHVKLSKLEQEESSENKSTTNSKLFEFYQVNNAKLNSKSLRPSERIKLLHQIQQLFDNSNKSDKSNETLTQINEDTKVYITQENFLESLRETKPSISFSEKAKLSKIYNQFVSGRDGNMPDGSASNEIGGRTTLM
ncbi:AAA ATPase, peroxisomal biogenesis [Scheffersomyces amazonensis]|uniref:AAA ATPase, peroxisomal biogenesis n=1 Tax=Scheffersomyces amazonensis TaxID=1078765 RepID=UPI00315CD449